MIPAVTFFVVAGVFFNAHGLRKSVAGWRNFGNFSGRRRTQPCSIIPDSVIIIGDGAFYYSAPVSADSGDDETAASEDGSLKSVEIPDSVLMIGSYAFEDCKDLTDITIPASVTRIGENAFEGCSGDLTIHGVAGSRAESYAAEYGINFVVDGEEKTETSVSSAE